MCGQLGGLRAREPDIGVDLQIARGGIPLEGDVLCNCVVSEAFEEATRRSGAIAPNEVVDVPIPKNVFKLSEACGSMVRGQVEAVLTFEDIAVDHADGTQAY